VCSEASAVVGAVVTDCFLNSCGHEFVNFHYTLFVFLVDAIVFVIVICRCI
jgi:hypothetical protein